MTQILSEERKKRLSGNVLFLEIGSGNTWLSDSFHTPRWKKVGVENRDEHMKSGENDAQNKWNDLFLEISWDKKFDLNLI